jgi:hypothetical protein
MKKQKRWWQALNLPPEDKYMDVRLLNKRQFQSKSINPYDEMKERVEGPPLWVWAVIVGAIILAKFTLRWSGLKRLARELRKR